ncbi:MAG: tetratricopeptide repeat protein [Candidatus Delongbacteria bacterium]|jgi:tetratricopeptide (TPR) repeat protein|nr:hypothetical protein [Candidatus Delongbacteria bacterium]
MRPTGVILLIFLCLLPVLASDIENKELSRIDSAVDMMYNEKFEDALSVFISINETYPDHPAGPFFMGYYYNFLASFYETDKFDSKIVLHYNNAEKKADFHLGFDKNDPWMNFYKGASLINRGYLLSRDGRNFSALSKTLDGISFIKEALRQGEEIGDAKLLYGTYLFYRSEMISWIWDKRPEAVKIVSESIESSNFSRYLAVSTLGWMYIDYEKFGKAEEMADLALEKYPESHLFLFLKARSLFEQKKFDDAEQLYLKLLLKIENMEARLSNIDLFNSYYFLSRIYYEMSDHEKSRNFRKKALGLNLSIKEKDILEKRIEYLNGLKFR